MLLAAFMNLLDVSIVNIAIPPIQRGLHASYADVQWTLAGYALAYALVLITGGRLGDAYGRKRLFLIGVVGFTIMSALCGAAQSAGMLIACRVAQGAMGALMIPQVLAVIQVIFPAAERIKALAGFGMTAGLGAVERAAARRAAHPAQPVRPGLAADLPDQRPGRRHRRGRLGEAGPRVPRAAARPGWTRWACCCCPAPCSCCCTRWSRGSKLGWPAWTYLMMALSGPVAGRVRRLRADQDPPGRLAAGRAAACSPSAGSRRDGHRAGVLPRRRLVRAGPDAVPAAGPGLHAAARRGHVHPVLGRRARRLGGGGPAGAASSAAASRCRGR